MSSDHFNEAGYGGRMVGFGARPAILIVDFQLGFTHPDYPAGRSPHIHRAVENTRRLLEVARPLGVPVATCNVAWNDERDMGCWKVDSLYDGSFFIGHPATQLDPRIYDPEYDFFFTKGAPSIFFGTPLVTFLTRQNIDTTIICGCTTSGCIRASVVDSFSYGYRTIVAEDCVGDQAEGPHQDNLRDVGRRYADVMSLSAVIAALQGA